MCSVKKRLVAVQSLLAKDASSVEDESVDDDESGDLRCDVCYKRVADAAELNDDHVCHQCEAIAEAVKATHKVRQGSR